MKRRLLILAGLIGLGLPAQAHWQRRITVTFRFDDSSARSDAALEVRLLRAFSSRSLSCTFGVIPRVAKGNLSDPAAQEELVLPPAKARWLGAAVKAGTLEVAQHGLSHQAAGQNGSAGYESEFAGVPEAEQRRRISEGKSILEGALHVPIKTFIPPWNGYDATTLHVLEELGFRNLSAELRGLAPNASRLRFIPMTCGVANLRACVEAARRAADPAPVVTVLFHHSDFKEHDQNRGKLTFGEFETLLDWVAAQPDVRVLSIAEAAKQIGDLDARRFYWNREGLLFRIIPFSLIPRLPYRLPGVYLSTEVARAAKLRLWWLVISAYLVLALTSGIIVRFIGSRWPSARRLCLPALPAGLAAVLAYSLWAGELHAKGAACAAILLGGCVGLWIGRGIAAAPTQRSP